MPERVITKQKYGPAESGTQKLRSLARLWPLLLLALALPLLLIHSADRRLAKSDEVAYAAGALQISRGDNPIYPKGELSHYRQIGKPPGGLWPMAMIFTIFDHTPLSARLPTLFADLLLLLILFYLARLLGGNDLGAALVVLLLLAQPGWLALARKIWLENLLATSFLLSFLLHIYAQKTKGKQRLIITLGMALSLSYGLWVKHAVGLAPFAAIALAELALAALSLLDPRTRRLALIWPRLLWTGVEQGVALILFAPWWISFSLERGGMAHAVGKIGAKLQAESNSKRKDGALLKALSQLEASWILYSASVAALLLLLYLLWQLYRQNKAENTAPALPMRQDLRAQLFLLLALLALLASHLIAFGVLSQKLRNWYLLPIVPIFALLLCAAIGRIYQWLRDRHYKAGLAFAALSLLALSWPIGQGLKASFAQVQKDPGPDRFAQLAARWRKQKLDKLIVDKKNWDRPGYFKPMLYFYFSPLPMQPMKMGKKCDQSLLHSGDFVLVHWTQMGCIRPRAAEDIHVTPWWRVFRIK